MRFWTRFGRSWLSGRKTLANQLSRGRSCKTNGVAACRQAEVTLLLSFALSDGSCKERRVASTKAQHCFCASATLRAKHVDAAEAR